MQHSPISSISLSSPWKLFTRNNFWYCFYLIENYLKWLLHLSHIGENRRACLFHPINFKLSNNTVKNLNINFVRRYCNIQITKNINKETSYFDYFKLAVTTIIKSTILSIINEILKIKKLINNTNKDKEK